MGREIAKDKKNIPHYQKRGDLPGSPLAVLFLDSHEIFISRAFMRIHTIFCNPLCLPGVELGRAGYFFNGLCMASLEDPGFDVFTTRTKWYMLMRISCFVAFIRLDVVSCLVMLYAFSMSPHASGHAWMAGSPPESSCAGGGFECFFPGEIFGNQP